MHIYTFEVHAVLSFVVLTPDALVAAALSKQFFLATGRRAVTLMCFLCGAIQMYSASTSAAPREPLM